MPENTPTTGVISIAERKRGHRHRGGELDPGPVGPGEGKKHVVGHRQGRPQAHVAEGGEVLENQRAKVDRHAARAASSTRSAPRPARAPGTSSAAPCRAPRSTPRPAPAARRAARRPRLANSSNKQQRHAGHAERQPEQLPAVHRLVQQPHGQRNGECRHRVGEDRRAAGGNQPQPEHHQHVPAGDREERNAARGASTGRAEWRAAGRLRAAPRTARRSRQRGRKCGR